MKTVVILISGRGSNMRALLETNLPDCKFVVISNQPTAEGLAYAKARGLATLVIDHRGYPSRADFDVALSAAIDAHQPDLLILAGFMRILGESFVRHYQGRLINIHPSLL
ncbi:MAG: formyltransferase family protein, partial [Proteobacteria bacterium]|nr:formyltransferase family protein [Pseudomonadota bacterium]